jgi:UDP-2-acetamido-2,6-beta-L-arabino-hexul-4-ose reductase
MKILITGSNGFIGKNLVSRISEMNGYEVLPFVRGESISRLAHLIEISDAVIHLAGENRPPNISDFEEGNASFTSVLCDLVSKKNLNVPIVFASSIQALLDNPYGRSKLAAETALENLASTNGNQLYIYRLPGVFGKWCKPNYNSVVATFCHNIASGLDIKISDSKKIIQLAYVDDVVDEFMAALLRNGNPNQKLYDFGATYNISLGELASQIKGFSESRSSLVLGGVGEGLTRALYATYISFLSPKDFSYPLKEHSDQRGIFVEMLKTPDSGQISFFTAKPGITRGGHYHHTKSEKFLVVKGSAKFGFRNILTDETYSITATDNHPIIVETVPGWSHDICNVGSDDLIVMLWANEIFDEHRPDTICSGVI